MTAPTPSLTEQTILQLQRELAAAQERAQAAEAERDEIKRHAEAMAEELQWIACRYDDSKSTRECAADAYEMKSAAAQALHAYRAAHQDGGAK